jgi:uncharacterized repeat protein (TIGR03806 family)
MRLAALAAAPAALVLALAACGGEGDGEASCTPPGQLTPDGAPPQKLSELCLLAPGEGGALERAEGVVPFDLNTPLFSDYALKDRTVWLPPGTQAVYDANAALDLPVGAVVTKTFSFPPDLRAPEVNVRRIETRVLVRGTQGFRGFAYRWDADGRDATLLPGGAVLSISFTSPSGEPLTASYLVPSAVQCARCHSDTPGGALHLLGPTARNLNRAFPYPDGAANQLTRWNELGILAGAPAPEAAPRLPVWDDPATGTVAERARAWLEVNCASCHNPGGLARTSGLFLAADVTDPYALGVCKPPVAAGPGSGGRPYGVVPGSPDDSILLYRIESTDPAAMMPQLGRSVRHAEGAALVRAWIEGMPATGCP